jgi:hypothetical protein
MSHKNNKCLVVEKKHFLWFKWEESRYKHNWHYKNTKMRKCTLCGKEQVFVGQLNLGEGHFTDGWTS